MPQYKDRDEFLDGLFDHMFPESDYPDGVEDEDEKFFEHVASFFEDKGENGGSGSGSNAPRRRRRASSQNAGNSGNSPRRRRQSASNSGDSGYGSNLFFRS